jgi:ABC-2 type transport system permease protein
MLPLDLLPASIVSVIDYLPFKYLAYLPPAIFLGRYTDSELIRELTIEAVWIVALLAANRVAFHRGVRRYSAYGG